MKISSIAAIALAAGVCLLAAAPASAGSSGAGYTLTADVTTLASNDPGVVFTTDAPGTNFAAFFIDGEYWGSGLVQETPNPFMWDLVKPCVNVVATYRVYNFDSNAPEASSVDWNSPSAGSVNVTFTGDPSWAGGCDETYGVPTPPKKNLASTGVNANLVAAQTAAGVLALTAGVAVLLKSRRAKRVQK